MPGLPPISGRRIKGHRDRLGIRQRQLAEHLGIGLSTLQGIERNSANPGLRVLIGLTNVLTGGRLDLLCHQGLSDEGEYNDARWGNPHGPPRSAAGGIVDLRTPPTDVPEHLPGGGDEVWSDVQPLRRFVRPDPRGAQRP